MKPFLSPLFLGLFALVFSISSFTYAASTAQKKPTPAPKSTPKPTPKPPTLTLIESITADAITIATGPKKVTYKIDKNTKFLFDGQDATAKDLKAGMRVSVTPAFDDKTAEAIYATSPHKPASAPKAAATPAAKGKG